MGEGGAIITKKGQDKKVLESIEIKRIVVPGQNDTCGRRYDWELIFHMVNHKYIYSNIGYNYSS